MRAVKATRARWIGTPEKMELSWGKWPFCSLAAFIDSGLGLRIRLGPCRGSYWGKEKPSKAFGGRMGVVQQIGKLRSLTDFLHLLQVELPRKQILNLRFAFGGLLGTHLNTTCVGAREPVCGRSWVVIHIAATVSSANFAGSSETRMAF